MSQTASRPHTGFSPQIDSALRIAAAAHQEDVRKGTRIPYLTHPFHVGLILDRHGFSEDVVIAGIFHDVLEDPNYAAPSVQERLRAVCPELKDAPSDGSTFKRAVEGHLMTAFGEVVFDLIGHVTERKVDEAGKKRDWKVRKTEQLDRLAAATREQSAVKAADCLHNLRSMIADITADGPGIMDRFEKKAAGARWYNAHASALVAQRLGDTQALSTELCAAFHEFEALLVSTPAVAGDSERDQWTGRLPTHEGEDEFYEGGPWIFGPGGKRIHGFGHWFTVAPPRSGAGQWKDGASAKELARAWTRGGAPFVPRELSALFASHPATTGLVLSTAYAEHVTPLPVGPEREGRNHDLLALGVAGGRKVVIGIEAKAAEPLGSEVGPYRREAEARNAMLVPDEQGVIDESRRSFIPERIHDCALKVFGNNVPESLDSLRYQVLHASAATILEAERRGGDLAVFLVQQFAGDGIDQSRVDANKREVERFVRLLSRDTKLVLESGRLYGPYATAARTLDGHAVDLLVGEATSLLS